MRTFVTVVEGPGVDAALWAFAGVMAKARHWAFREIHIRGKAVKDVKRAAIALFGITARQFNGIRYELDQQIGAARGILEYRENQIAEAVKATAERIARLEKQLADVVARAEKLKLTPEQAERRKSRLLVRLAGKKRRLDILHGRLAKVLAERARKVPGICFGGRKPLRDGDLAEWHLRRVGNFVLVGAACESFGNQTAQWRDGSLFLRMPDACGGKVVRIDKVDFRYGGDVLRRVIAEKRCALTWRFYLHEDGRWRACVTIDEPPAEIRTSVSNGAIGADLNVDHLAVVVTDANGNPVRRLRLNFPVAGVPTDQGTAMIGEAVKALTDLALELGVAIVIEDLDFRRKKAGLREFGAAHARRLSAFAFAKFGAMMASRCSRTGVALIRINPAFTSVIGRAKYAVGRAMSVHHAAALVIARAAQGFGERLVAMDGTALDAPGRMRPRTERRRWRGVRRLTREGLEQARFTARSERGAGSKRGASRAAATGVDARSPPGDFAFALRAAGKA